MLKYRYFFLILGVIFAILNCNKKSTGPELEPPVVIFVPCSEDTSEVEKGIDAVPEGDVILIEWYASTDDFVDRYEIYRSESEDKDYSLVEQIEVPDTSYLDLVPEINVRYYYYILAINIDNIKSESSDTVFYELLKKAEIISPKEKTNVTDTRPLFQWKDPNEQHLNVIRLRDKNSSEYIWISQVPSEYSDIQEVEFNSQGDAKVDTLTPGINYEWRIDVIGGQRANTGSESEWATFAIQ